MEKESGIEKLVSIIIVTFNSEKYILDCLKAIFQTRYPLLEVIVVDNNSTDNTVKIIKDNFPKVKIIESKVNLGYATGNNLGIKTAQGKYIAVINPDTRVTENWVNPLISELESK